MLTHTRTYTQGTPDVLYISHGGGPLPLLGDPAHRELVVQLKAIANELAKPSAILVISAHWEAPVATVTASAQPDLLYDYSGFPAESYQIKYPAPGSPALAEQLQVALQQTGMACELDTQRGLDHGVFVPLKIMYPQADIPVVQLSLVNSLDARTHIQLGQALQQLDLENVLVMGSGFSFHNMRAFFTPSSDDSNRRNQAFEDWLKYTCVSPELSEAQRLERLANWEAAPDARFCHPREEHLLPLHVCYGLARRRCEHYQSATVLGKTAGMFYWPAVPADAMTGP